MTAAYRLRGIGWFISSVVVVLACYLVSLQVAAERKRVEDIDRAILQAKRDIRALETEFNTRANMAQLERWNGEVLALAVPTAEQYVRDDAALADVRFDRDAAPGAKVQNATLVVPAAHAEPTATPAPAPTRAMATAPASPVTTRPAPARAILASVAIVSARSGGNRALERSGDRSGPVALLDRKALRENRLGDLIKDIPLESGGAR